MKSNIWEERGLGSNVSEVHENELSDWEMPQWMIVDCPFCGKKLSHRSVREFGVKLNPRNLGDIFVLVLCEECELMDTLYFRQEVGSVPQLIPFLSGDKNPVNKPIIEEEMYKMRYNNLIEKKLGAQDMPLIKKGTCESSVVVSSMVFTCADCGHMEVVKDAAPSEKSCPKCGCQMKMISSSGETSDEEK